MQKNTGNSISIPVEIYLLVWQNSGQMIHAKPQRKHFSIYIFFLFLVELVYWLCFGTVKEFLHNSSEYNQLLRYKLQMLKPTYLTHEVLQGQGAGVYFCPARMSSSSSLLLPRLYKPLCFSWGLGTAAQASWRPWRRSLWVWRCLDHPSRASVADTPGPGAASLGSSCYGAETRCTPRCSSPTLTAGHESSEALFARVLSREWGRISDPLRFGLWFRSYF